MCLDPRHAVEAESKEEEETERMIDVLMFLDIGACFLPIYRGILQCIKGIR